jgi:hypothetical protein
LVTSVATIRFTEVFEALSNGKHVRQNRWDAGSELFVQDDELVELCHGEISSYQLDWRDMNRKDWRILA